MKAYQPIIEPLESRIAPAAVFTYTSTDGGTATITTSKGTNAQLASAVTITLGQVTVNLSKASFGTDFAGANIAVTEKIAPTTGNGLVNIGWINAAGIDLGSVTVKGDLGEITAGDLPKTPAIKSFTVQSMGQLGLATGAPSTESDINGSIGTVVVKSDLNGVDLNVDGNIGSVIIGGSIIGGSADETGIIEAGTIGSVKIGGSIIGGAGRFSGAIDSNNIKTINIGGSIIGGSGSLAGEVSVDRIGTIHIGGSVIGGSGPDAGEVQTGNLGAADIAGSLIGGSGVRAGEVLALNIDLLKIGGDIQSGKVVANATLVSLIVNGRAIGSSASGPAIICAEGVAGKTAIGSIQIHGDVNLTNILAGYSNHNGTDAILTPDNGNAQIGSVKVGGDWIASNLVAGVENTTSSNANFGDSNDALIPGGNPAILAKIASITIGGQVQGTLSPVNNTDSFGFVAQEIGSMSIGGTVIPLNIGESNDNRMIAFTGDVTIHEV